MDVLSKRCWAWDEIEDLRDGEGNEHDVHAAEACARLTYVPATSRLEGEERRMSSGRVDIGALLRAARKPAPRERRAPPPHDAPRSRIARASAPEHVRHARQRSFVGGTLIGGSMMAAVALVPSMISIARAPQPELLDPTAMEPVTVTTTDGGRRPGTVRNDSDPPTRITRVTPPPELVPPPTDGTTPSPAAHDLEARALRPVRPTTNDELEVPNDDVEVPNDDTEIATTEAALPTTENAVDAPITTAALSAPDVVDSASDEPSDPSIAPASTDPPSLDRLIADAVGTPSEPTRPAPAEVAPAPVTTPTRDEVDRALANSRASVEACAAEGHGLANVRITVAGSSGRVTNAVVVGPLAGTPAGSCVARAVRGATFPPFAQPTFTVHYPFQL